MGDHVDDSQPLDGAPHVDDNAAKVPPRSTQEKQPWRAVVRTILAYLPGLLGAILLLPLIIDMVLEGYGDSVPEGLRTLLLGVSGFIVVTAGVVTRILAHPAVNDWLRAHAQWLAPDSKQPPAGNL